MKRVEIFVEGISELIFVRDILLKIYNFNATKIYIHCNSLNPRTNHKDLWERGTPGAEIHIEITDVVGYTNLLSAIADRRKRLEENKVSLVLGLRDIDSSEYTEFIRESFTRDESILKVQEGVDKGLSLYDFGMEVKIFYAVLELEAWFLALYKVFVQIDSRLTNDYIKSELGLDLESIDPEKDIEDPCAEIEKVFALVNKSDDKPRRTTVIVGKITLELVDEVKELKVARMHEFIDQLKSL